MEREIVICAGSGPYYPNHTHYPMHLDPALLHSLAEKVGTPFWLYDAATLRRRISEIQRITSDGLQARFAMKSCPATKVLSEMHRAGVWIDAVCKPVAALIF